MGSGREIKTGRYWNVVKPGGAAEFRLRFGASWLFLLA